MNKLFIFSLTAFCVFCIACASFDKQAVISLEGNVTTGYYWSFRQTKDDIVREVSNEYIPKKSDKMIVGSGGDFLFVFEGLKEGETELIFEYARPWEKDIKPIKSKRYIFKVDSNKKISYSEIAE